MAQNNAIVPATIVDVAETERRKLDVAKPDAQTMLQVQTARAFPRSIKAVIQTAKSMATVDRDTAGSCFYKIPRSGKMIEGPSIRLAEIMASAWGNIAIQGEIGEITETHVVATGAVWDMQNNVPWKVEHRQKITGRDGRRYSEDMITTTANASVSKALRNAIFRAIPRAYVSAVENEARRVAVGDQRTLAETRDRWIVWFAKLGINEARVLAMLQKESIDDVDLRDLETLTGVSTAIREGHSNINEIFPPEAAAPAEPADGVGSFKRGKESAPKPKEQPKAEAKPKPEPAAKPAGKKPGRKPGLVPQIKRVESADLATLDDIAANDERSEIVAAIERRRVELAKDANTEPAPKKNDSRERADGVSQTFDGKEWVDDVEFANDPPPATDDDAPQGGFGFGS